jgi:hypothetical protein
VISHDARALSRVTALQLIARSIFNGRCQEMSKNARMVGHGRQRRFEAGIAGAVNMVVSGKGAWRLNPIF